MEITKLEVNAVVAAHAKAEEILRDLTELELATIGGGVGDILLG